MQDLADQPLDWSMLDLRFHMLMMRASDWKRLVRLAEEPRRNVLRYINEAELHRQQAHAWHEKDVAIYETVRERRLDDLERLVEKHWRCSAAAARDYLGAKSAGRGTGATEGKRE